MIEHPTRNICNLESIMEREGFRYIFNLTRANSELYSITHGDEDTDDEPKVVGPNSDLLVLPNMGPNLPSTTISRGANSRNTSALCNVIGELRDIGRNDVAAQVVMLLLSSIDRINSQRSSIGPQPNYMDMLISGATGPVSIHSVTPSLLQNLQAEKNALESQGKISPINCPHEVVYNHGVSLLNDKRPRDAFINFMTLLNDQNWNPRLWCRLAEACIMYHEMSLVKPEKIPPECSDYLLPPSAGLSIQYAALCLKNALTLLKAYRDRVTDHHGDMKCDLKTDEQNICSPLEPFPRTLITSTMCFTYIGLSYAYMRLGHFNNAYKMACEVFQLKRVGKGQKVLAHLYAAEAMMMLDNLGEHCELKLIPCMETFDQQMSNHVGVTNPIMHFQLALENGLKGKNRTAVQIIKELKEPQKAPAARFLRVFLDMSAGKY